MAHTATSRRGDLLARLREQIVLGESLLDRTIETRPQLAALSLEKADWSLRNRQLLYTALADRSGIREYQKTGELRAVPTNAPLADEIARFRLEMRAQLGCLERIMFQVG